MSASDWAEVSPDVWQRAVTDDAWLGVRRDGGGWCWKAFQTPPPRRGRRVDAVAVCQCYGIRSADEAKAQADAFAGSGALQ
jgi:hypothetical protein